MSCERHATVGAGDDDNIVEKNAANALERFLKRRSVRL